MYALPHGHYKVKPPRNFSPLGVFARNIVSCLPISTYNNVAWCFGHWHPPRSRSGYTGLHFNRSYKAGNCRDNAAGAVRSELRVKKRASICGQTCRIGPNPERRWLAGSTCLFDTPFQMLIVYRISTARPDGIMKISAWQSSEDRARPINSLSASGHFRCFGWPQRTPGQKERCTHHVELEPYVPTGRQAHWDVWTFHISKTHDDTREGNLTARSRVIRSPSATEAYLSVITSRMILFLVQTC